VFASLPITTFVPYVADFRGVQRIGFLAAAVASYAAFLLFRLPLTRDSGRNPLDITGARP
jgi:hypothetical protein